MSEKSFQNQIDSKSKYKEDYNTLYSETMFEENAEDSLLNIELGAKQENETKEVKHTTEKLYYEEMLERIQNKKYDRGLFVRWKKQQSESMKLVTESMKALSKLLSSQVDETDFIIVRDAYKVLQEKCLDYLTSHHPKSSEGIARKDMVKKIFDRVSEEMRYIEVNSELVTEKDKTDGKKWSEILAGAHVLVMSEGTYEVPGGAAFAGTSSIVKIKGKKQGINYFFKNREKTMLKHTGEALTTDMIGNFVIELTKVRDHNDPVYKGLTEEQRRKKETELMEQIEVAETIKKYTYGIDFSSWEFKTSYWGLLKREYNLTDDKKECVEEYLKNLEKKIKIYRSAEGFAKIPPGSDLDIRNVATSVLANYLGISGMIAGSTEAVVELQGQQQKGIRMDEVDGEDIQIAISKQKYLDKKKIHLSVNALNQFMKLQVFDVLCGQVDRNVRNYMVKADADGEDVIIERITAIDNDMSFGLLSYTETTKKKINFMSPIQQGKEITLMGLDAGFADKILAFKPEALEYLLGPYLTKKEIKACEDRLKGIQMLIREMKKRDKQRKKGERPLLITEDSDWLSVRKDIEGEPPEYKSDFNDEQRKEFRKKNDAYLEHMKKFRTTTLIPDEYRSGKSVELCMDQNDLQRDIKKQSQLKKVTTNEK